MGKNGSTTTSSLQWMDMSLLNLGLFCRQKKRVFELKLCASMETFTTDSVEPE